MIKAKTAAGLGHAYLRDLKSYLTRFSERFPNQSLSEITVADVEAWFDERGEKLGTRASNIGRLSSLFSFAKRRGLISESPIDRLEKIRVTHGTPRILTLDECRTVLDAAKKTDCYAYFLLCLFSGIRPEECQKLPWKNVLFDRALVHITPDVAKTNHQRFAPIPPNCLAALRGLARSDLVCPSHSTVRRRLRAVREALKWSEWPQDVLRHTAISMWVAHLGEIGKVAYQCGNSEKIIRQHYLSLVSQETANDFFKLTV